MAMLSRLRQIIRNNRSFTRAVAKDALLASIPELSDRSLTTTRLLASRIELLKALPASGVVGELGVFKGDFSARILEICCPSELHLVDSWTDDVLFKTVIGRFQGEPRVHLHRGLSWEVPKQFPDAYFDWVYIDAAHDYESVRKDLAAVHSKVKSGGFITGHDYTRWAVTPSGVVRYGVVEAVNEFINETGYALAYLTNQSNRHLSFAIRVALRGA
jgi:hypothetical protein